MTERRKKLGVDQEEDDGYSDDELKWNSKKMKSIFSFLKCHLQVINSFYWFVSKYANWTENCLIESGNWYDLDSSLSQKMQIDQYWNVKSMLKGQIENCKQRLRGSSIYS